MKLELTHKLFKMRLINLLMIAILAIISQGCSKSNSQSNGNEEEQITEEEPYIEQVVVYNSDYGKNNLYYYNIAFKVNGQYVIFNNDADYQDICQSIFFLQKAVNKTEFMENEFGFSEYNEWIESAEHASLLKALPEKVEMYLSGMKSEIGDKRIQKMLDEVWYNFHPDRLYFNLDYDGYGFKEYKDSSSNRGVSFRDNKNNNFKDLQGNDLPSEALVAYAL